MIAKLLQLQHALARCLFHVFYFSPFNMYSVVCTVQ